MAVQKAEKSTQHSRDETPGAEQLAASEIGDAELIKSASQVKRFFEGWQADPKFREQLIINPDQTAARYNLSINPDELRPLWDPTLNQGYDGLEVAIKFKAFKFRNGAYAKQLGELIHQSDKTAEDIAATFDAWSISQNEVLQSLDLLFTYGVLDDEPDLIVNL